MRTTLTCVALLPTFSCTKKSGDCRPSSLISAHCATCVCKSVSIKQASQYHNCASGSLLIPMQAKCVPLLHLSHSSIDAHRSPDPHRLQVIRSIARSSELSSGAGSRSCSCRVSPVGWIPSSSRTSRKRSPHIGHLVFTRAQRWMHSKQKQEWWQGRLPRSAKRFSKVKHIAHVGASSTIIHV